MLPWVSPSTSVETTPIKVSHGGFSFLLLQSAPVAELGAQSRGLHAALCPSGSWLCYPQSSFIWCRQLFWA